MDSYPFKSSVELKIMMLKIKVKCVTRPNISRIKIIFVWWLGRTEITIIMTAYSKLSN